MHEGNITDQQTLPTRSTPSLSGSRSSTSSWSATRDAYHAHAKTLTEQGIEFISALKAVQVRALVNSGDLQLSLFDETNLAELPPAYLGERLVVCRTGRRRATRPQTREHAERHRDRAREGHSDGCIRRGLRDARAGKIGERAGKIINKHRWPSLRLEI